MIPIWILKSIGSISFILLLIGAAFPEWERFSTGRFIVVQAAIVDRFKEKQEASGKTV